MSREIVGLLCGRIETDVLVHLLGSGKRHLRQPGIVVGTGGLYQAL